MEDFLTLLSFGAVAWIVGTLVVALLGSWLTWRDWRPEDRAYGGHLPPHPVPAHGPTPPVGSVTTDTFRVRLGDPRCQMSDTK